MIWHLTGRKQKELSDLDKSWHEGGHGRCKQSTIPKHCGTVDFVPDRKMWIRYSHGYLAKITVTPPQKEVFETCIRIIKKTLGIYF